MAASLMGIKRYAESALTWSYARLRGGPVPRPGLRVLVYHALGTPADGDALGIYSIVPARFESHMRYLATHHRESLVPLGAAALTGDRLRVALTFDDGYRDNWIVAAPLLQELDIPFTVFVCTGAVARRRAGFLSLRELRALASQPGVSIGSHGVSHIRLTECDERRLREELVDSKNFLEDIGGREVVLLSYPHGAVDRRVRDAAASAGYLLGTCSHFDYNPSGRDPLVLCRTDIWADDDVPVFEEKLRGDWDWMRWRHCDPAKSHEA